jgi:putative glutamine amidotransferase
MRSPVIGIAGTLDRCPATSPFSGWNRDITNEAYTTSLFKAGALPIMLPVLENQNPKQIGKLLSLCDGLLLPGGSDIDPTLYGEERHTLCKASNLKTDRFQLSLFKEALERQKPILGICKGSQLINVAMGGTLFQDYHLRSENSYSHDQYDNPTKSCHFVNLEEGSNLNAIFNKKSLAVNSLHHQQIKTLGRGLKTAALAEDGGIEAIEAVSGSWCLGVQWHPEALMMATEEMLPLFRAFVYACRTA